MASTYYVDINYGTAGVGSKADPCNDLLSLLKNTYSGITLAAGDIVIVRTANSTISNYQLTLTASQTFATIGDTTAPLTVIFDDGTEWTESGTFLFLCSGASANYGVTWGDYTHWIAEPHKCEFKTTYSTSDTTNYFVQRESLFQGVHFHNAVTAAGNATHKVSLADVACAYTFVKCKFSSDTSWRAGHNQFTIGERCAPLFIDCEFDYTGALENSKYPCLFGDSGDGIWIRLIGGKLVQPSTSLQRANLRLTYGWDSANNLLMADNFHIHPDNVLRATAILSSYSPARNAGLWLTNPYGNQYEFVYEGHDSVIDFRLAQNYPYASATLPDGSNTGWSFKIAPTDVQGTSAGSIRHIEPPEVTKFYDQTAAAKTLSLEFLFNDGYTSLLDDRSVWMMVTYVDSTGTMRTETTYNVSGSVATSTTSWTNDTYGSQTYVKRKCSHTTAHSIKEDSLIQIKTFFRLPYLGSEKFFFVNPEIDVT